MDCRIVCYVNGDYLEKSEESMLTEVGKEDVMV